MDIQFKADFGYFIVIKAENVHIEFDIEQRDYKKGLDGKITSVFPNRDVKTESINDIVRLLSDMIYYREADYNSSDLIEQLFEKLPSQIAEDLSKELAKKYSEE